MTFDISDSKAQPMPLIESIFNIANDLYEKVDISIYRC
jgi:hypothetical protein